MPLPGLYFFLAAASLVPFASDMPAKFTHGDGLAIRFPQEALDPANYPIAPTDLELLQVHVFVRHGERSPVSVRLSESPASIPEHWLLCKTGRQFFAAVSSFGNESEVKPLDLQQRHHLPVNRIVEREDGVAVEGECLLGELTDVGRKSTYDFGSALRSIYIDRLGFLPDTLSNHNNVYFRSTNMPRTIESLRQVVNGLYPHAKLAPGTVHQLLVRNGKDENLIGNTYACQRLQTLLIKFAQAAAVAFNPALEPLDRKLSKYIGGNPIRIDGNPRASGILDTIKAAVAHGITVPPEFEDKSIMNLLENAVVHEWFEDKTEEVRRLAMGRLLDDLHRKMEKKIKEGDQDPVNILVHSTHDTAIAGLSSTLEIFEEKWPPFTASLAFELFRRKGTGQEQASFTQSVLGPLFPRALSKSHDDYFVRVRYQNRNKTLPFCAAEGDHLPGSPEFCTFSAFEQRVKELVPVDWHAECAVRSERR